MRLARVALTVCAVTALAVAFFVLMVFCTGRRGLRRLAVASERGAISLVELVVVTVLASVLLLAVASVAAVTERSSATASAQYGATRRANVVLSSAMSAMSDASPLYGCVLTTAGQQSTAPQFTTPLSQCAKFSPATSAVEAASSSGLCWYAYAGKVVGLAPPALRCLVAYSDHTLWSFDWPATASATYTSCQPNSCFAGAPQPGSLPSEPTSSTASAATFAGRVGTPTNKPTSCPGLDLAASTLFVFTSTSGCIAPSASNLSQIYGVELRVVEAYGAGQSKTALPNNDYQAYVGSAVEGGQQSYSSI